MDQRYSLTNLSSLSEDQLKDILVKDFGFDIYRLKGKKKSELMDLAYLAAVEAEKRKNKGCGDGCKPKPGGCDGCSGGKRKK